MGKNSKRRIINERTYRGNLDRFLVERHLRRKPIAKDGSCLFRAVSEQVYSSQCSHQEVRQRCAEYIRTHSDDFKEFITVSMDEYISHLTKELWGGELELVALSRLYNRSIVVYNEQSGRKVVQEELFLSLRDEEKEGSGLDRLTNPILLAYSDGNHYDIVYSIQYMDDLAFCQGILYIMLMERVFKDSIPLYCKKKLEHLQDSEVDSIDKYRRHGKYSYVLQHKDQDYKTYYNLSHHYESELVMAMSWTLHYNSALSLHQREKEGIEHLDRNIAASIQFHVGDKCYFLNDGKRWTGEIASLNTKPGIHLVHVNHSNKKLEVSVSNITLVSSQIPQGKPRQQQLQESQKSPRSASNRSSGGNARSHQSKDKSVPVSSITSGSVGDTTSNPTAVTVTATITTTTTTTTTTTRKGNLVTNTVQSHQAEHGQKMNQDTSRKKSSSASLFKMTVDPIEKQVLAHKSRSLGKSNPPPKNSTGLPHDSPPSGARSDSGPRQPVPLLHPAYSSVVKKTSGGPSGSLTSEGTEYESSGEEGGAQEEKEPVSSSIPNKLSSTQQHQLLQQQQQQSQQQHHKHQQQSQQQHHQAACHPKSSKPLLSPKQGGLKGTGYNGEKSPEYSNSSNIKFVAEDTIRNQEEGLVGTGSTNREATPPIMASLKQEGQESPYLERQIPQDSPSRHKDAWPSIEYPKELPGSSSDPPPNTMIYAAIMTNRANQVIPPLPPPPLPPVATTTTSPNDEFLLSTITTPPPKAGFPSTTFNMEQIGTAISPMPSSLSTLPKVYSSPHLMPQSNNVPPNPSPRSVHGGLVLSSGLLDGNYPAHVMRSATTRVVHHQFDSSKQSLSSTQQHPTYVVSRGQNRGGYQSHTASQQHSRDYSYGDGITRECPTGDVSLPFTTVAAGKEMRDILGIHGDQMINPPIYTESRDRHPHHPAVSSVLSTLYHPITRDTTTQTLLLSSSKEVQVGPDVVTQSVQTEVIGEKEMGTQTEGVYFPVQDISPPQNAQIESIGDAIIFSIRYGLQCLSVFSQTSSTPSISVQDLAASLNELLEDNLVEDLFHRANEYDNIVASQQKILNSSGIQDMTPQQEQHLSPGGIPKLPVHPPNFPVMIQRPFMLPPPHGHMPMYYPIMPLPPPTMGYMPLMPPPRMMPPHQVAPPLPGVAENNVKEDQVVLPFIPNSAYQELPMQYQDVDGNNSSTDSPSRITIIPNPSQPLVNSSTDSPTSQITTTIIPNPSQPLVNSSTDSPTSRITTTIIPNPSQPLVNSSTNSPTSRITTTIIPNPSQPLVNPSTNSPTSRIITTIIPNPSQPQSEMVASSSVYPIPPVMMMTHADSSNHPPAPSESVSTVLQPSESHTSIILPRLQPDLPPSDPPPNITSLSMTVVGGNRAGEIKSNTETQADEVTANKHSPSHKRLHRFKSSPNTPHQQKGQQKTNSSRRHLQPNSDKHVSSSNVSPSQPGLPCRPLQTSGQVTRPEGKHSHDVKLTGNKKASGTKKLLEVECNLKTESHHGVVNSKRLETDEPALVDGRKKKELSTAKKANQSDNPSRERNLRSVKSSSGKKRYDTSGRDHSGTSTVAGPSPSSRKTNQDPSRAFSHVYGSDDGGGGGGGKAIGTTNGGMLDTIDFQWGVPSPNQPDVAYSSPNSGDPLPNDVNANCQSEKTEWPDFAESVDNSQSVPANSFSGGLRFVFDGVIPDDYARRVDNSDVTTWNEAIHLAPEDIHLAPEDNLNPYTETLEDPFRSDDALRGRWNSDNVDDYTLTLSSSSPPQQQGLVHAQCTGDLTEGAVDRRAAYL